MSTRKSKSARKPFIALGCRATRSEAEILTLAAKLDAKSRRTHPSRNLFILHAALDHARSIITSHGLPIPGDSDSVSVGMPQASVELPSHKIAS